MSACRGQYVEDFYPENNVVVNAVRDICMGCPVRAACLTASIPERYGFWAGMTLSDRNRLRSEAGIRLQANDADVPRYRRAAEEGWRTGDYAAALGRLIGIRNARQILEDAGVLSRRVA